MMDPLCITEIDHLGNSIRSVIRETDVFAVINVIADIKSDRIRNSNKHHHTFIIPFQVTMDDIATMEIVSNRQDRTKMFRGFLFRE